MSLSGKDSVECKGSQGKFKVPENKYKSLMSNPLVLSKLKSWNQIYNNIYREQNIGCLSVQQPFAEAICRGVKKFENRSSQIFKLNKHVSNKKKPDQRCRFCCKMVNNSTCPFWLHSS